MECEQDQQLHAYYDGEVSDAVAAEVERHLLVCAACQARLAALRGMSEAFDALPPEPLSRHALARAHALANRESAEASLPILRIGMSLVALAASILVIAWVWTADSQPVTQPLRIASAPAPAQEWERVAMTLNIDRANLNLPGVESGPVLADASMNDSRLADWMVRSLSR